MFECFIWMMPCCWGFPLKMSNTVILQLNHCVEVCEYSAYLWRLFETEISMIICCTFSSSDQHWGWSLDIDHLSKYKMSNWIPCNPTHHAPTSDNFSLEAVIQPAVIFATNWTLMRNLITKSWASMQMFHPQRMKSAEGAKCSVLSFINAQLHIQKCKLLVQLPSTLYMLHYKLFQIAFLKHLHTSLCNISLYNHQIVKVLILRIISLFMNWPQDVDTAFLTTFLYQTS